MGWMHQPCRLQFRDVQLVKWAGCTNHADSNFVMCSMLPYLVLMEEKLVYATPVLPTLGQVVALCQLT